MSTSARRKKNPAQDLEREPRPASRVGRAPVRALNLGNRFAARDEDLDLPDPSFVRNRTQHIIDVPELSPDVWHLFEVRESKPAAREARRDDDTPATLATHEKARPAPRTDTRVISILLVEDNPGHVRLMEEAFKESSFTFNMNVVEDGVEALAYLRREGAFAQATEPDLILLDLNLPRKDGREVISEIKADEKLGAIPVIVLSSSNDEEDVKMSYAKHANCYISKPVNLAEFANVVQTIESFWGGFVRLP